MADKDVLTFMKPLFNKWVNARHNDTTVEYNYI